MGFFALLLPDLMRLAKASEPPGFALPVGDVLADRAPEAGDVMLVLDVLPDQVEPGHDPSAG